jgi:predicted CopG family antitoxin
MVSKTISVTEEVYNLLKRIKLPRESFGEAIERICSNYTSENLSVWFDNANGWQDMSSEEFDEINQVIKNFQGSFKPQIVE